jgi:hypothetical protein
MLEVRVVSVILIVIIGYYYGLCDWILPNKLKRHKKINGQKK